MSVGPVRYGMRVRPGSPPPPGAGPRYRSRSCWPATLSDSGRDPDDPPFPLTTPTPINSLDIISCVNRMRIRDVGPLARQSRVFPGKKRTPGYARLSPGGDPVTLDRLPRFRFGGNRAPTDQKFKEFAERLRKPAAPVPPPRTKKNTPPQSPTPLVPLRSASFSQVDFSVDDNKYVRRKPDSPQPKEVSTLPRPKNNSRPRLDLDISEETEPTNIPEVEITPVSPDKLSPRIQETLPGKKREKSRRRKGIYISQWPNTEDVIPQFVAEGDFPCVDQPSRALKDFPIWSSPQEEPLSPEDASSPPEWPREEKLSPRSASLFRSGSLSEGEPEQSQISLVPSDLSDCESRVSLSAEPTSPRVPRRYSKRPLRGPYGQMLENEMKKPDCRMNLNDELQFLEDLSSASVSLNNIAQGKHARSRSSCSTLQEGLSKEDAIEHVFLGSPKQMSKRKVSADNLVVSGEDDRKLVVSHQRTTSSPSKLEVFSNPEVNCELLERLLRGSSEQLAAADLQRHNVSRIYSRDLEIQSFNKNSKRVSEHLRRYRGG
ncbi:unnamed protein product [Phaedon cochleariae]|uniref:Uncharacterized protein n=1 Tax=Phaedon cochleariae TaxID=80249 RepID=A0A9N9SBJ6_PHACE|nr:unnamed protein product [Phaedon cochleariae]